MPMDSHEALSSIGASIDEVTKAETSHGIAEEAASRRHAVVRAGVILR